MKRFPVILLALASLGASAPMSIQKERAPVPADNPMTPEKIELGRKLFFDKELSRGRDFSCNTCHNVTAGRASGSIEQAQPMGANGKPLDRNPGSVWNAAFSKTLFWDGRAKSLEEQLRMHLSDERVMGYSDASAILKQASGYSISLEQLIQAIATYERTLIATNSPFDRYLKGDTEHTLGPSELRGMKKFQEVGCMSCHGGANFDSAEFAKFPVYPDAEIEKYKEISKDLGRFTFTGQLKDKNVWRVPSLRNVDWSLPYLHNGSLRELERVVEVMARLELGKTLSSEEVSDITRFLKSLNGVRRPPKQPKRGLFW